VCRSEREERAAAALVEVKNALSLSGSENSGLGMLATVVLAPGVYGSSKLGVAEHGSSKARFIGGDGMFSQHVIEAMSGPGDEHVAFVATNGNANHARFADANSRIFVADLLDAGAASGEEGAGESEAAKTHNVIISLCRVLVVNALVSDCAALVVETLDCAGYICCGLECLIALRQRMFASCVDQQKWLSQ